MIPCNCVVQEGQIPDDTAAALRASISEFTERAFGAPAEFSWLAVPERSGFTASAPSTSSIISLRAPRAVSLSEREPLLRELCGIWTDHTKCSLNEIVGVISDPVAE
ncbi:MAG: hypothetical protein HRT81_01805 [Henriciella sp.]|nr:hypothetical protein [Henriciella sp.]